MALPRDGYTPRYVYRTRDEEQERQQQLALQRVERHRESEVNAFRRETRKTVDDLLVSHRRLDANLFRQETQDARYGVIGAHRASQETQANVAGFREAAGPIRERIRGLFGGTGLRGRLAKVLDESGITLQGGDRERVLSTFKEIPGLDPPEERLRQAIREGKLGDVTDVGVEHTEEGAPLPLTRGTFTLPEAAAMIGTAGLGTTGLLPKVGGVVGETAGGIIGREIGGSTGEAIGSGLGAVGGSVAGAVAPSIGRAVERNIATRPGGLASEAGGSRYDDVLNRFLKDRGVSDNAAARIVNEVNTEAKSGMGMLTTSELKAEERHLANSMFPLEERIAAYGDEWEPAVLARRQQKLTFMEDRYDQIVDELARRKKAGLGPGTYPGPEPGQQYFGPDVPPIETTASEVGGSRFGRAADDISDLPRAAARRARTELPPTPEGTGEELWKGAINKLNNGLRTSATRLGQNNVTRSAERAQRLAAYTRVLRDEMKKGTPSEEALALAKRQLGSEYSSFTAPNFGLSEAENEAIWRRAATFDYKRKAFDQVHVSDALWRITNGDPLRRFEINALRNVYGKEFATTLDQTMKRRSLWDALANSITIPRTIMSAYDVSYPFRQGSKTMFRHPKEFFGNIKPMLRSFARESVAQDMDNALKTDALPIDVLGADGVLRKTTWGQISQDVDILRPLPGDAEDMLAAEEGFLPSLVGKLPGIRNSGRSFTTYGNKLRSDIGKYWVQRWVKQGEPITDERLMALGNLLNRLTGRGTLGDNAIAQTLQALGWAPRYRVSGPQAFMQMFHSDPKIRQIAIENLVPWVAGGVSVLALAKLSGAADVQLAPGPDFGKMRFGKMRVNIFGTDQLLARNIYQIITGKSVDYLTGEHVSDWKDVLLRYGRSGLAPEGGIAADIITGRTYIGDDMAWDTKTLLREIKDNLPLSIQDIRDAWMKEGPLAGVIAAPYSLLGGGISTYETPEQRLAAKYNEQARSGAFGPNATIYKETPTALRQSNIAANPELAKLNSARDTQSQQINLETEVPLVPAATAVTQNASGAGEAYRTQRGDILRTRTARKEQAFGTNFAGREADKALDAYYSLEPTDVNGNGFVDSADVKAFYEQRDAILSTLPPELQAAVNDPARRFSDPQIVQAETRYQGALGVYKAYMEIPKYKGLTPDEGDQVDELRRAIEYTRLQSDDPENFSAMAALSRIAGQFPRKIVEWYRKNAIGNPYKGLGSGRRRGPRSTGAFSSYLGQVSSENIYDPRRDELALDNPDLIYFGFVSPTSLGLEQRALLPDYILQGRLNAETLGRIPATGPAGSGTLSMPIPQR